MIKRIAIIALAFTLFASSAAHAADEAIEQTLRGSVYGGIVGALIGGAILLVSENPDDNLNYIAKGAGVGILAGAAYGFATSTFAGSLAEVENGKLKLGLPTFKTTIDYEKHANVKERVQSVDLLKINF